MKESEILYVFFKFFLCLFEDLLIIIHFFLSRKK